MTTLPKVLALLDEVTPGEWRTNPVGRHIYIECRLRPYVHQEVAACGPTESSEQQEANAEAIAAVVNFLRANRDRLQRALALLAAVESGEWKCVTTRPSIDILSAGSEALSDAGVDNVGPEDSPMCYAAMLASAPPPPIESVSPWRPIETAPKDGRYVLLVHQSSGGRPYSGRWCRVDKQWADERECIRIPTHWMPLPAAPAAPGVEG